jgi:hypothetical protein
MDTSENKVHFLSILVFPFRYFRHKEIMTPEGVAEIIRQRSAAWQKSRFSIGDTERGKRYDKLLGDLRSEDTVVQQRAEKELTNLMWEYNEWHYFHPYVRDMIYETHLSESKELEFLTRTDYTRLCVQTVDGNDAPKHMSVDVKSIDLHLYNNQIGLLTITTESEGKYTFAEMLRFNDNARRVYSPYLGWYEWKDEKKTEHREEASNTSSSRKLGRLIPNTITLSGGSSPLIQQVFGDIRLPQSEPFVSKIITELLSPLQPSPWKNNERRTGNETEYFFKPFTDDRMFIVSFCANNDLSHRLSGKCCNQFEFESSTEWYRFIFVDGAFAGIANETMKRELVRKHTYARWVEYGTLFGMSRYSFVVLADEGEFSKKVIYHHVKRQYYQLAILILFQRAMLLKFSQDVKDLTKELQDIGHSSRISESTFEKADTLHGDFIRFTNRYWHEEVTPQEQGIEIYNEWLRLLDHDRLYEEVKGEIDDVANYLRTRIGRETEDSVKDLTLILSVLTWWLLILTIWLVLFGDFYFRGELLDLLHLTGKQAWDGVIPPLALGLIFVFLILLGALPMLTRLKPLRQYLAGKLRRRKQKGLRHLFFKFILGIPDSNSSDVK